MAKAGWFFGGALVATIFWLAVLRAGQDKLLCLILGSGC